jgi:hypothetical protein
VRPIQSSPVSQWPRVTIQNNVAPLQFEPGKEGSLQSLLDHIQSLRQPREAVDVSETAVRIGVRVARNSIRTRPAGQKPMRPPTSRRRSVARSLHSHRSSRPGRILSTLCREYRRRPLPLHARRALDGSRRHVAAEQHRIVLTPTPFETLPTPRVRTANQNRLNRAGLEMRK